MIKYEHYSPSGIDWLGEIPSHWRVVRLKYLVARTLEYGANEVAEFENEDDPRYLRITDFDDDGFLRPDTFKSLPETIAKQYLLSEGDILFARSGATVGKTFQFKNFKGRACYAGYLIKATPGLGILSDYLYFFTKSNGYDNWKNSVFNQATIQNIGADKYNVLPVPTPPLSEQRRIAEYLSKTTTNIKDCIDKKRELIQLLIEEKEALINSAVTRGIDEMAPVRPSGVGWLGDIPQHWSIKRLKYLSSIVTGERNSEDRIADGIYPFYVRSDNIERINTYSYDGEAILTAGDGVGVAKVFHYVNGKFDYHQRVYKLSDFKEVMGKYLYYYVRVNLHKEVLRWNAKSTVDSLRLPMFQNFMVAYPTMDEQNRIVQYIEKHCVRIEETIARLEKEIELMEEYKSSLIYEVVTGKLKVDALVQEPMELA
jgi:type I restriction enzyme, S subunit